MGKLLGGCDNFGYYFSFHFHLVPKALGITLDSPFLYFLRKNAYLKKCNSPHPPFYSSHPMPPTIKYHKVVKALLFLSTTFQHFLLRLRGAHNFIWGRCYHTKYMEILNTREYLFGAKLLHTVSSCLSTLCNV